VCVGGLVTRVCACTYIYNMVHTQIGGQEKKGQIEPVQKVRRGCTYGNDTVFDFPSTPWGSIHVDDLILMPYLETHI